SRTRPFVRADTAIFPVLPVNGWRARSTGGFSSPERVPMTSGKNRGFSLLELLIVISIGLIMAGVTFMAMKPLFNENHVDQAYDTTLSVMRNYRKDRKSTRLNSS